SPTPSTDTLSLHDALPIYWHASQPGSSIAQNFGDDASFATSTAACAARAASCEAAGCEAPYEKPAFVAPSADTALSWPILSVVRSEEHTSELQSRENLVCR